MGDIMSKKFLLVSLVALAAGCGADPEVACENYIAAWGACIDEAYADDTAILDSTKDALDGTCDAYSGLSGSGAKEAADLLNCYADTIDAGDCSDGTTYLTTVLDITSCLE